MSPSPSVRTPDSVGIARPLAGGRHAGGSVLTTRGALLALGLGLTLGLVGCGGSPITRYHTLLPGPQAQIAASQSAASQAGAAQPARGEGVGAAAPTGLIVGPVTVPESLDRPQLVIRISPTEQRVLEQRRWIQPFDREIRAALVGDLARRLPGTEIAALGQNAVPRPAWRVFVDITRFEVEPGRGVWLQARWALRDPAGQAGPARDFDQRVADGADEDFDALVAAAGRSLDALAQAIAEDLRRSVATATATPTSAATADAAVTGPPAVAR